MRLVLGAFLSGIVLMIWGTVFWVVLPFPNMVLHAVPREEALRQALTDHLPESGYYLLPWHNEEEYKRDPAAAEAKFMKKHRSGPLVQIVYQTKGLDPMAPLVMGIGFVQLFVSSLIAGLLLLIALPALGSYKARVCFVFLLGVFASVAVQTSGPVWFHHPWDFPLVQMAYTLVNWLLAGAVLGWALKPKTA